MKLANPKTIIPLQENGQLQPLPEYPPGATAARNASEQELLAHNQIELGQKTRDPQQLAEQQAQLGDAQKLAQDQQRAGIHKSETTPAVNVAPGGTQGATAQPVNPVGALAPSQLPATGGDVNAAIAPKNAPAGTTEHSAANPSVADAQAMDPMKSGGDSSNLSHSGKKGR